jgi:DHA2 family methylenomycin A resistance protein-like MFS transporter
VPFDWLGQVSAILAIGALTFGLIEGGVDGFTSTSVMAAFLLAVASVVVFLSSQAHSVHPKMPLELFRSRPVTVSVASGFSFTVGFYGLVFLLSLYFQQVRGLSAVATGLAFVPMTALSLFVVLLTPRAAARFGPRIPMAVGQFLMATGLLCICVAAAGAPIPLLSLLMMLVGLGSALSVPTLTAVLLAGTPAELAGAASGVLNTSRHPAGWRTRRGGLRRVNCRLRPLSRRSADQPVDAALLLLATAVASLQLDSHQNLRHLT